MPKKSSFLIFVIILLIAALCTLVACDNDSTTQQCDIIAIDNATINGTDIFMVVPNSTASVALSDVIKVSNGATWRLYRDIAGEKEISTKIAAGTNGQLANGDSTYYIVTTSGDGKNNRTYTLQIHRSYAAKIVVKSPNGSIVKETYANTYYSKVSVPDITFDGYTISGWRCSDSNWIQDGHITGPVTFTPICQANNYHVTFDTTGGSFSDETCNQQTVTFDTNYRFPVPSRTGYVFNGWKLYNSTYVLTDSEGNSKSAWNQLSDTTVYADWIPNEYSVATLENNSCAGSTSGSGQYAFQSIVTVTATTNAGYTFLGWYQGTNKVADTLDYSFTMPSEAITLTANWCKTDVLSNNSMAGTVSTLESTYFPGETVSVSAFTNPGYIWLGWYNGDTKLSDDLIYSFVMPSYNQTITAHWCKVTVNVNDEQAGTVTSLTGTYLVGDLGTVTAITNPGYIWLGWYNDNNKVAEALEYSFAMPSQNACITAKWCRVTTQSNNLEAGTTSELIGTYVPGDEDTLTAISTSVFFNFIGWYDADDNFVSSNKTFTLTMPAHNTFYTAKWELKQETSANSFTFESTTNGYKITSYTGSETEIIVPSTYNGSPVVGIDASVFLENKDITSIYIPDNIQSLPFFAYCNALKNVYIGDGITSIPDMAFNGCSALTSLRLSDNITSIGNGAFAYCSSLSSINLPKRLKTLDSNAFFYAGIKDTSVTIPKTVTYIGAGALWSAVQKVYLEDTSNWQLIARSTGGDIYVYPTVEELSDPTTVADYMQDTYQFYTWKKVS